MAGGLWAIPASAPVFAHHEAADTAHGRRPRRNSHKQLSVEKASHAVTIHGEEPPPEDYRTPEPGQKAPDEEGKVEALAALVASLQEEVSVLRGSLPPQSTASPPPLPSQPGTSPHRDPSSSPGICTSHAAFTERKRRHAAVISTSPTRQRAWEGAPGGIPTIGRRREALTPSSPHRAAADMYPQTPPARRSAKNPSETIKPCSPHTSHAEFAARKRKHRTDLDSPKRRRASEVPHETPPPPSPPSKGRTRGAPQPWEGASRALPYNALELLQGVWVSEIDPPRAFRVHGDMVTVEGRSGVYKLHIFPGGIGLADETIAAVREGLVVWSDGDVWRRFDGGSSTRHRGEHGDRSAEPHRTPPDTHPVAPPSPSSHYILPSPSSARPDLYPSMTRASSPASPRRIPPPPPTGRGNHLWPSAPPPAASPPGGQHGEADQAACPNCQGALGTTPFCPVTGMRHERHRSMGRCPNGHKLHPQPPNLGSIKCSTCGSVFPSNRFAGCRGCDYDVCDSCLQAALAEELEIVVVRKPNEGTGAICGQDLKLEEVVPGSPADQRGMRCLIGRTLTHVNNVRVSNIEQACDVANDATTVSMRFM